MEIKIINSLDEITETGVRYAHVSRRGQWIQIDKDAEKEFCVYGMVSGNQPTTICASNVYRVKYWKTFNGVIRSLKKYSQDGGWGMRHWMPK